MFLSCVLWEINVCLLRGKRAGEPPPLRQMKRFYFLVSISLVFAAFSFYFRSVEVSGSIPLKDRDYPIIDFSYAGYGGGIESLPDIQAALFVRPTGGDDTALLQAALDRLAKLPAQPDGFRGALQFAPGKFRVAGQLRLQTSGVVLRGSADKNNPTIIVATGLSRRALIEIGKDKAPALAESINVIDEIVPAGNRALTIENTAGFNVGDSIVITRPSTAEWIAAVGMNKAEGAFADQRVHWLPGSRNLVWDRKITAIDAGKKQITLDAPITFALEKRFGGGTVAKATGNEFVNKIGLENLILESEFERSNPKDEEHAWIGVALDNVEDAWIRGLTARHFAGSAIRVGARARRVTIEDCRNEQPVSEIGGYRRLSFLVEGQQTLVRNCFSDSGINDFAVGLLASGPNVFLDCTTKNALGANGSFESLAAGVLFENVRIEGAGLRLTYDMERAQGGGWTAANSVIWNSEAKEIEARAPEGAANIVRKSPEPLYAAQRLKRLSERQTINPNQQTSKKKIPEFRLEKTDSLKTIVKSHLLEIVNGRFVIDNHAVWGGMLNGAWWKGQTSPAIAAQSSGVSITRFVPGRTGFGLTEDLPKLAARMIAEKLPFFNGGPGLWYDRRRDDHTIVARSNANVWAPFYEMPWARSGQGTAFDGLSKYDLTRFNSWYFERTREFARLSEENGLVYYHNLYNTHNLLETAAHWVDFPWRAANNINNTGLEPPLEARNTIHVANQFYDPNNPRLRELHRAYILHNLAQLGATRNVIFIVAFQFAGPLEFQQFFLDTVAEWEKQNKRKVKIALITSKDITDAILNDPARSKQIAVVDMRYWQYRPDGSLWAPPGGKNLAFREMITQEFRRSGDAPPPTTPEQVYRQVREYRDRFPEKALVVWNSGVGQIPILMAGGAQALMRNPAAGQSQGTQPDNTPFDDFVRENLAAVLMKMSPKNNLLNDAAQNWCLADAQDKTILIYSLSGSTITFAQTLVQKNYQTVWFDPRNGKTQTITDQKSLNKGDIVQKPSDESWLLLLKSR